MNWLTYCLSAAVLYAFSFTYYAVISKGLGHKAFYLQMRRFLPCALLACLPAALADTMLLAPPLMPTLLVGLSWMLAYPTFYCLTNRKSAVFFNWPYDFVFGFYLIAILSALQLLCFHYGFTGTGAALLATLEVLFLVIPVLQAVYYRIYGVCVSEAGLMATQQTDYNETLEFLKAFGFLALTAVVVTPLLFLACFYTLNLGTAQLLGLQQMGWLSTGLLVLLIFALSHYLYKSVFKRMGLIELFFDVKDYFHSAQAYETTHQERFASLQVDTANLPQGAAPHTIIVVIGESASRDHMSLFSAYPRDTTPWLTSQAHTEEFFLFPHAYACWHQTIPVIERALTEANQYNELPFNQACSVLDLAKKAGYTTSWFSNQGHLGCADTQVTLIANTADNAKWTQQELNKVQYDEALLDYVRTVDPTHNNFIILHLMGSHDNFQTRYPAEFTKWGTPGKYHLLDNYDNSLAYTDALLQQIKDYAQEHLGLAALVYFSDHATIPDKRRQPNFSDFALVRIPMFVYIAKAYQALIPVAAQTLRKNTGAYFTNDLIYDLVGSLLGVTSNRQVAAQSIASPAYKFTRETLTTNLGKTPLTDDHTDDKL
ncbi:MAG: phosphoethanolamine transferase [Acidaminococcaceae bacterium]